MNESQTEITLPATAATMLKALIKTVRPEQWTKNLPVFAGLIFARHLFEVTAALKSLTAFLLFCFLSGVVYIVNDIKDVESDRAHPTKCHRPIAAGQLPIFIAILVAGGISMLTILSAFILSPSFGWIALSYLILLTLYSFILKHIVILDVLTLAIGFVFRAIAGAVVLHVEFSVWLLLCTLLGALFLGLNKRRHELVLLGDNAHSHRKILLEYSPYLLDQMIGVVTASTLMAYALYTMAPETKAKFGTSYLILTVPFVIYGIFRYLYLVHQKEQGGNPTALLVGDRPSLLNVLLWGLVSVGLIYRWFFWELLLNIIGFAK
jgi:4-hydroxybenzoate polyprenyltransferase